MKNEPPIIRIVVILRDIKISFKNLEKRVQVIPKQQTQIEISITKNIKSISLLLKI